MGVDIIKRLAMGAFVGCFIVMLVMVFISLQIGPSAVNLSDGYRDGCIVCSCDIS